MKKKTNSFAVNNPWILKDILLAILITIFTIVTISFAILVLGLFFNTSNIDLPEILSNHFSYLFYILLFIYSYYFLIKKYNYNLNNIFGKFNIPWSLIAFIIEYLLSTIIIIYSLSASGLLFMAYLFEMPNLTIQTNFFTLISLLLLAPVVEEFFYRGILQNYLIKKSNVLIGIFIASILFGFMHINYNFKYGFFVWFLLGPLAKSLSAMLWGYIYYKKGSLWIPIFAHFGVNLASWLSPFWISIVLKNLENPILNKIISNIFFYSFR